MSQPEPSPLSIPKSWEKPSVPRYAPLFFVLPDHMPYRMGQQLEAEVNHRLREMNTPMRVIAIPHGITIISPLTGWRWQLSQAIGQATVKLRIQIRKRFHGASSQR